MKKLILALLIFICPVWLLAAPSISSVTGTIDNNQSITISGSGFGSGPTVAFFDDFEAGTNGSTIGTASPKVGSYAGTEGSPAPIYDTTRAISGTKSFRATETPGDWRYNAYIRPGSFTKYYFAQWMWCDVLPGPVNWKPQWATHGIDGTTNHDWTFPTITQSDGSTTCASNDLNAGGHDVTFYGGFTFPTNTWIRISGYHDGTQGGATAGSIKGWHQASGSTASAMSMTPHSGNASTYQWSSMDWDTWYINAYGPGTSGSHPTFDDVYLAIGDHAQARVEIGNNATYASCTKITICTPTSWSSSSIAATVRQGIFTTSDHAYAFIIDDAGTVSSSYDLGMFGGSSGGPPPNKSSGCFGKGISGQ